MCSCVDEHERTGTLQNNKKMKRRNFIKSGTIVSAPLLVGGIPVSAVAENAFSSFLNPDSDRILVLIQLAGGNDGLNCVVPLSEYSNLTQVRPEIVIPENSLIELEGTGLGFHPSMQGLYQLHDSGNLCTVQSVAYPNQNRSHFRSTDIWNTASAADQFVSTGWLGRYFDAYYADYPAAYPNADCPDPFALTIGNSVSETCQGLAGNFSLAVVDPNNLSQLSTPVGNDMATGCYADKLTFLNKTIEQTNKYGGVIQTANDLGTNMSDLYGFDELSEKLKTVARLIKGGLRTKIYIVSLGGFDTHADQVFDGNTASGTHAELMRELSESIAAFQDDLIKMQIDNRVVGMTYSEFGRRIRQNGSFGTDHGTAAPLFVFGSCVWPGVIGDNVEISTDVDQNEGVPMQYDFRSVYGSILTDWLEVEESIVRDVLFGDFQKLNILKACPTTSSNEEVAEPITHFEVHPNPFSDSFRIEFESTGGRIHISLFDSVGGLVRVLTDRTIGQGSHNITLEANNLAAGAYYVRIQSETGQKLKRLVKMK